MAPWLIITGSGSDYWIYWHLLKSLLVTINYSSVANLPTSQITRTRSILLLVLRCTSYIQSQNQSQSYFTTGCLPSSRQAPCDSRPGILFSNWTLAVIVLIKHPPGERMGLSFTIAAGPHQRSHSQIRFPRDSWPHFTVSDSRLPKPGGPGLRIYIPEEQGGPVIPPGTGFSFRRLLRLAGLRWRYSNPPPHGILSVLLSVPSYSSSALTPRKTLYSVIKNVCLLIRYLAMVVLMLRPKLRECVYRAVA
jgi:hypothetical protein